MKPLNLPKLSQEALLNGANMFLMPCNNELLDYDCEDFIETSKLLTLKESPYQIGDEVYLQEEFAYDGLNMLTYKNEWNNTKWEWFNTSEMKEHQSRYKGVITNIKVVRVQDIIGNNKAILMNRKDHLGYIEDIFEDWYNKQYNESAYERNDYVFLYTIEEIK